MLSQKGELQISEIWDLLRPLRASAPPGTWVEAWVEGGKAEGLSGMLFQNGGAKKSESWDRLKPLRGSDPPGAWAEA
jgi:hypothetical protein